MALASHGGPPHPASPYPGGRQSDAWLPNHAAILIAGVILFVVILAGSIMLGHRHMETTTHTVLTGDKTTAGLLAAFIEEHNKATLSILQSYANRPRFIDAVKNKEEGEAGRYLSDLQKNANIDLTFVTDPDGILWINFPYFSEAIGQNLSHREWYQGISSQWKPYISSVFKLIVADKSLAVAVCVPVYDEKERVVGILASSQRLEFLKETVENQPLFPDSQVTVIDREGQILYSNTYPYRDQIARHPLSSDIVAATEEKKRQVTITRQQQNGDRIYLTVDSLEVSGWSVVVQRSRQDIFRGERSHFIELASIILLFFALSMFLLIYLKKISLFKRTEKMLRTEQELRALSARHEAILAAVPEIIMEVDTNKVYTWANSMGREFFGDDVLGKEASFYFDGEQDTYDKIERLFQGFEERIYVESWQRRRDGEIRLLAWWCRCLKDGSGNVSGGLFSAYDITEHKRAEEELRQSEANFRAMVETIPLAIYMSRGEEQVGEFLNREFKALFGYTLEDIPTVGDWWPLAYPDGEYRRKIAEEWTGKVKQAIAAQAPIEPMEVVVTCRDGTTKDIAWGFMTMGDKNYAFGLDLTERKKAEEKNRLYTEELARSNVELQQFAYIASHDLQEPLRMISSYLQLLERRYQDKLDDDANTFIHYAVDGAKRMQALISGLLEFSRINTHGQEFKPVQVKTVLEGVLRNLEAMLAEAGAAVNFGEMPVIQGDGAQIARLFQNLLQNALKFRKKGIPPVIDIAAEKTGAGLVFSVRDNGIGIEGQYFERIFTIFQRLHTREEYPGTGIGLAICKRIVERHGGRIWLESLPDSGTTFYFIIPGENV